MARYSKAFQSEVLRTILPPVSRDLDSVSRETGVSIATLHAWLQQAGGSGSTSNDAERLSGAEKLRIVFDVAPLNEFELGEYCRRHGLFAEAIQGWRQAAIAANEPSSRSSTKLQPREEKIYRKRILEIEMELDRKNRALAELSALVVLEKKVQEIWGAKGA